MRIENFTHWAIFFVFFANEIAVAARLATNAVRLRLCPFLELFLHSYVRLCCLHGHAVLARNSSASNAPGSPFSLIGAPQLPHVSRLLSEEKRSWRHDAHQYSN